jgi:hypothetical protein
MSRLGHKPTCPMILFDHLVSELLEMQRHVEAQRLGGLEIDDQLKLCRHLQWKIGRLLTIEDAVDVPCRQAKPFAANIGRRQRKAPAIFQGSVDRGMLSLPYPCPFIVLSVFLKRRRCPPHRLRRASLAPSRLDRARSMPLHILRIRCWGFGPKDHIPIFAFISPWGLR